MYCSSCMKFVSYLRTILRKVDTNFESLRERWRLTFQFYYPCSFNMSGRLFHNINSTFIEIVKGLWLKILNLVHVHRNVLCWTARVKNYCQHIANNNVTQCAITRPVAQEMFSSPKGNTSTWMRAIKVVRERLLTITMNQTQFPFLISDATATEKHWHTDHNEPKPSCLSGSGTRAIVFLNECAFTVTRAMDQNTVPSLCFSRGTQTRNDVCRRSIGSDRLLSGGIGAARWSSTNTHSTMRGYRPITMNQNTILHHLSLFLFFTVSFSHLFSFCWKRISEFRNLKTISKMFCKKK